MLSSRYLLVPFVLQMISMAVDEFHFHRRRTLPRWERLGHPVDTFTVLVCFAWTLLRVPDPFSVSIYAGLCVASCLCVTKDERVHQQYCPAGEHWLHAVLFTLHPLVLISCGLLWPALHESVRAPQWVRYDGFERAFLLWNTALAALFGLYQLIYWNLIWRPIPANAPIAGSTTSSTIS